jgi:hypothetical protein
MRWLFVLLACLEGCHSNSQDLRGNQESVSRYIPRNVADSLFSVVSRFEFDTLRGIAIVSHCGERVFASGETFADIQSKPVSGSDTACTVAFRAIMDSVRNNRFWPRWYVHKIIEIRRLYGVSSGRYIPSSYEINMWVDGKSVVSTGLLGAK